MPELGLRDDLLHVEVDGLDQEVEGAVVELLLEGVEEGELVFDGDGHLGHTLRDGQPLELGPLVLDGRVLELQPALQLALGELGLLLLLLVVLFLLS